MGGGGLIKVAFALKGVKRDGGGILNLLNRGAKTLCMERSPAQTNHSARQVSCPWRIIAPMRFSATSVYNICITVE